LTDGDWKEAWRLFELARGAAADERGRVLGGVPAHIAEEVEAMIGEAEEEDLAPPAPGREYGKYTLVAPLGSGGMGEVFTARDRELGRMVAIKFVGARSRLLPSAFDQLVHEAQAASALNHPNLITVHEVLRSESGLAIVTELVKGKSLRSFTGAPVPIEQVAAWGAQIAHALAAAHAESIVHSDIKPENVMLRDDGYIKVLDFGLARSMGLGLRMDDLTIGTVGYMSPEQTRGEPLTGASDVFSLGVLLVELAAGKHPFLAETAVGTTIAIAQTEVNYPTPAAPGGKRFAALVRAMLDKDPARRPSVADAARALEKVVSLQTNRKRKRVIWVAGGVAALAAAGALFWLRPGGPAAPVLGSPVALTNYSGIEQQPAFSPDGRALAFIWSGLDGSQDDLYIRAADAIDAQPRRLTNDANEDLTPAFSPDGKSLAWVRQALDGGDDEVWVAPVSGGDVAPARLVAKILNDGGFRGLAWTPESRALIVRDKGPHGWPLVLIRAADGSKTYLTDARNMQDYQPVVSPDGKRLLFLRYNIARPQVCYAAFGPALGTPVCREIRMGLGSATWTLDSRSILCSTADALWLFDADGRASGPMTKLRDGVFANLVTDAAGRRYAYDRTEVDANIRQLDIRTQKVSELLSSSEEDSEPDISPDGRRILFRSARTGHFELYVSNRDGSGLRQLTHLASHCGSARWSPDGKWIAYDSVQDFPGPKGERKFDNIYVMPAEGGAGRRLTDDTVGSVVPNWSADSEWIYFSRGKDRQTWKVPRNGGAPVLVAAGEMWGAVESADGQWIYYEKAATGKGLWRRRVRGGPEETIPGTENLVYRTWQVRGDFLVFLSSAPRPGFFRMSLAEGGIGAPKFEGPAPRRLYLGPGTMSVSPDGKTILYTSEDLNIGDVYAVSPANPDER
jgi:hypothetical protein